MLVWPEVREKARWSAVTAENNMNKANDTKATMIFGDMKNRFQCNLG